MNKFRLLLCGVAALSLTGCLPHNPFERPVSEGFGPDYRPAQLPMPPAEIVPSVPAMLPAPRPERNAPAPVATEEDPAPNRKSPCEGITPDQVRDIEARFPQTMGGRPAMPVAVSNLYVSGLNQTTLCAADMIVTFDGNIGYQFTFLIERKPDRLHLIPLGSLGSPAPIRLYH